MKVCSGLLKSGPLTKVESGSPGRRRPKLHWKAS